VGIYWWGIGVDFRVKFGDNKFNGRALIMIKQIKLPLDKKTVSELKIGDRVLLSGIIYTARDAAHKRMIEVLDRGDALPFEIKGQALYYAGPSPAPPGRVIGSAGPTTSTRLDEYTPRLLASGLKAMIGKGPRSPAVKQAMKKHGAVYLAAIGGTGALISKSIIKSEVVAYADLGPEAVLRLEVKDFPVTVVNDVHGGDLYEEGRAKYRVSR
jgi:fumarate hydratase subunit beta